MNLLEVDLGGKTLLMVMVVYVCLGKGLTRGSIYFIVSFMWELVRSRVQVAESATLLKLQSLDVLKSSSTIKFGLK